jgi:V8-like Glu-specific endopeptidase
MIFQSGRYAYICSGGLIADTDNSYDRPLFLTANHCISKGREASSLETFFQYTTPCGSTNNCDFPNTPSTVGASIVSKGRSSDYTLLELSQQPPSGSHFLGWNSTPIATSDGTQLLRISHPSGSPQAYSEHEVDSDFVQCGGLPVGNFIYSEDLFGATEGGSSGSPVVDSSGKIVGQLYGGCGYNINDVCDAAQNRTVDGAFASYFSDIQDILDPQGCPATETICDDGIDNDCDGDTDFADSDCDGGGGGLPPGSPCESNSECESGKCKGRPGGMTCR